MSILTKNNEDKLLFALERIENNHANFYGIIFNLSRLQERNRSDFQLKIAFNIVKDFFRDKDDSVFLCKDGDIILVFQAQSKNFLEKVIFQLRYLFIDDPLSFRKPKVENPDFCSVYMLDFQWHDFVKLCRAKVAEEKKVETITVKEETVLEGEPALGVDLTKLENDINSLNLANFIRAQEICAISNGNITKIASDLYISIVHVRDFLGYGLEYIENDLIFSFLKKHLYANFINFLSANITKLEGPLSFPLALDNILSKEFYNLHNTLSKRSNVIIGISIREIFADGAKYREVARLLKELGYKICLYDFDFYNINYIDRNALGVDLIKFPFDPFSDQLIEQNLFNSINKLGRNRVILSEIDDQEALSFGQSIGISLFQGRYISKLKK